MDIACSSDPTARKFIYLFIFAILKDYIIIRTKYNFLPYLLIIVVFGEDVAFGGVFRCSVGLREKYGISK